MDFTDQIKQFSERIEKLKTSILTEEATKMSFIVPFFQLLGYDVFNPLEFCPEYTADVGIKKGEKVDYAILINGNPVILIEAKSANKKLEKHDSQLFRYFSTTNARFAILTNGIIYKFYSDISEKNKMDMEPFYTINLLNLSNNDAIELSKFKKESFDEEEIFYNASLLKYGNIFKLNFQKQFSSPNDEFVKFFLKDSYPGIKTQNIVDKFKPILKKSLNDYIDDLIKEKMTAIINDSGYITPAPSADKLFPTNEELDILMTIKNMLGDTVSMDDISYKKTESYFGILYKNNVRKWILRVIISNSQYTLIIPDENKNEKKFKINDLKEMNNFKSIIKSALNNYINVPNNTNYIYTKWGKYPEPNPYKINFARNFPEWK